MTKMDTVFTPQALSILRERYFHDGETKPEHMFRRVARYLADGDKKKAERYFNVMYALDFLPNSPTLMNAGRSRHAQLSACFVLPVGDSIEDIFQAVKNQAIIHQSGGGTGFSFNSLRPEGSLVQTTHGLASGPVSFMKLFETATQVVMQGGARRGANMGILNIDHPDIRKFVNCKSDGVSFQSFNLSVGMSDDFMRRLVNDELTSDEREIWGDIIDNAWHHGCPGLVFLDECNRHNANPELGRIEATNPCGEVPMLPFEACNLGSINLSRFVTGNGFDYDRLGDTVRTAVDLLNDVIDRNHYPLPEITAMVQRTRKIGLGVMGWGDALFKLGIRYGSKESLDLGGEVMKFIRSTGRAHSEKCGYGNSSVTCIAPTGTISMIAGCTCGGIEPAFALEFDRVVFAKETNADGTSRRQTLHFIDPEYARSLELGDGRIECGVFATSHEIPYKEHIDMQAVFQRYTDLAVSKTVNMPNSAAREDVSEAYVYAWLKKCKGITIYRDGCRNEQILNRADEHSAKPKRGSLIDRLKKIYAAIRPMAAMKHEHGSGECPECGGRMVPDSGCEKCLRCGYSPCKI